MTWREKETYSRHVTTALGLTVAILVSFQAYIGREPKRIAADEDRDRRAAAFEGEVVFRQYCTVCHGRDGEGDIGPPLNDRTFLKGTADNTIASLIGSGVPGTEMPAWNQVHGGPLTDEQIRQVVVFLRGWEASAPDRSATAAVGNPVRGLLIFDSTCIVCHGKRGSGTDRAPALNDPAKLTRFDDEWYAQTIGQGRPSRGMPTWGTVLSPAEIRDLIALLRAWQRGETVAPATP